MGLVRLAGKVSGYFVPPVVSIAVVTFIFSASGPDTMLTTNSPVSAMLRGV